MESAKMQVLVKSLRVGDTVWSGKNIVRVIAIKDNQVSVQKLEAPKGSIAQFGISFYSSASDDLLLRVTIATSKECSCYLAQSNEKSLAAKQRFLVNFPG